MFKNESLILCYHNVSSKPSGFEILYDLNHPPEVFERQIKILRKFFEFGDPCELSAPRNQSKVYLTFDDGFKGSLTEGLEILERNNVKSLHFLNMSTVNEVEPYWVSACIELYGENNFLEKPTDNWIKEFEFKEKDFHPQIISTSEIGGISENSLVCFGNHLWNHYNATKLSDEDLIISFDKNEKELLKLNNNSGFFAYPFGQPITCYNLRTNQIMEKTSARAIFTAFASANSLMETKYFYRYSLSASALSCSDVKYELIYQKVRSFFLKHFLELKNEVI